MNKFNPTDEQLLSFLIGDVDQDLKVQIEKSLHLNNGLKERLHLLALINGEIKNLEFEFQTTKSSIFNPFQLIKHSIFAVATFCIGLYIESQFQLLSRGEAFNINSQVKVSRPFTWNESQFSSLM